MTEAINLEIGKEYELYTFTAFKQNPNRATYLGNCEFESKQMTAFKNSTMWGEGAITYLLLDLDFADGKLGTKLQPEKLGETYEDPFKGSEYCALFYKGELKPKLGFEGTREEAQIKELSDILIALGEKL